MVTDGGIKYDVGKHKFNNNYINIKGDILGILSVRGITVLCHFHKNNNLMPVISYMTSLTFWSLFHVISIPVCSKTRLGLSF